MRLQELFLIETTEEDRAIISLSHAISDYINSHYDNEDMDDLSSDNPDFDFDDDELDIGGDEDKPIDVGTIGQLFDTPLEILNPITIQLQSDYGIRQRRKKDTGSDVIRRPGEEDIMGLWYNTEKLMILNKDYLGSNDLKSVVSHELRHALDDFKSGFKANVSKKYSTPRDKAHRKVTNDPYVGNVSYLAEPAEINARFLQVLHAMVPVIQRAMKLAPEKIKPFIMSKFKQGLEDNRIAELFPQKEKSKDYKRLMKRGIDFIQKEMNHQSQLQKTSSF